MIMRIAGFDLDINFDSVDDVILVVKEHRLFANLVTYINAYTLNKENNEVIFMDEHDNIVKYKNIVFVSDFITYELGSKQLLNKVFLDIKNSIIMDYEKESSIQRSLNNVNSLICDELAEYNIDFTYDFDLNIESYMKLLNIKINNSYSCLYDKIIDFIELYSELYYDKCVVIVNLLCYLSDDEIEGILKYKRFKKMDILFLENSFDRSISFKKYVIDDDFYAYKE